MNELLRAFLAALVAGAGVFAGARLAGRLADPYSEPRLRLQGIVDDYLGGGDPE